MFQKTLHRLAAALAVALLSTALSSGPAAAANPPSRQNNPAPSISGTPAPTAVAGTPYEFVPTASDPNGDALSFRVLFKPAWATFDSSTGRLAGTPSLRDVGRRSMVSIRVSDGTSTVWLPTVFLTVENPASRATNRLPAISGTPSTSVTAGSAYAFQPSASDPDGDALTFSVSGKPSWAAFNTATGALTGTPTSAGTHSGIVISVSDGKAATSLSSFTITVTAAPNRAPVIGGAPVTSATAGQPYAFQPTASDPDGDALTFSVSGKPSWAAFNTATGALTGTPTSAGTHSGIVISVSDGKAATSLSSFTITVTAAPNRAPVIGGAPVTSATAGQPYAFQPTASDPDGDALTFSVSGKPSWAAFNTATGALTGTPTSAGTHSGIVISVSDGKAATSLSSFTITVTAAPNRAPVIGGAPVTSATAGQPYAFQPTASDPDGDALTFSVSGKPSWAAFNTATGALTGTPTSAGTHSGIVISVSDGKAATSLSSFTITVTAAPNRAPVIGGAPVTSATAGQPYAFQPTASDPDGDALTFSVSGKPSWAAFNTATGALTGTPTSAGTHSGIVISVSDGKAATSLSSFTITVTAAPNRAPVIGGAPVTSATAGQPYAFQPTASDPDGDALTFSVSGKPSWAAFNTATGALTGTPTSAGTHSGIVISVSDGKAATSLSSFTITVTAAPNRAPVIGGAPVTSATAGQPYAFQPSASDPDGDALTFSVSGKPSWATFDATSGTLYGTPADANVGSYPNIVIRASDGKLVAALAAFTITVAAAPTKSVTLNWTAPTQNVDGTTLSDLAGYTVYYGTASRQYQTSIKVPGAGSNAVVIEGLPAGTWYFAIKSYTNTDVASDFSSEATAAL